MKFKFKRDHTRKIRAAERAEARRIRKERFKRAWYWYDRTTDHRMEKGE